MQRSINLEPITTPRLRRRRSMRLFHLFCLMLIMLISFFLLVAHSALSSRSQGAEDKLFQREDKRHSRKQMKEHSEKGNAVQEEVVISQDTEKFLLEMTRRMESAKNVCLSYPGDVTLDSVIKHMAADSIQEKFLYCVVPHPASEARLADQLKLNDLWNAEFDEQGTLTKNKYPPPKKPHIQQQEELFTTRFLITRHPLQRLLDSYISKFENGKDAKYYETYGKTMVTFFRERPAGMSNTEVVQLLSKVDSDSEREQTLGNLYANPKGPTFTEFVQYVVNSSYPDDVLWTPIHEHCDPCTIHYNFILSFEELEAEGDQLLLVQGASMNETPKKESALAAVITEEESCSYFSQLSNELMLSLVNKYNGDFLMFSYSRDPFVKCADEYVRQ